MECVMCSYSCDQGKGQVLDVNTWWNFLYLMKLSTNSDLELESGCYNRRLTIFFGYVLKHQIEGVSTYM